MRKDKYDFMFLFCVMPLLSVYTLAVFSKALGIFNLSWLLVLSPVWVPVAIGLVLIIGTLILALLFG